LRKGWRGASGDDSDDDSERGHEGAGGLAEAAWGLRGALRPEQAGLQFLVNRSLEIGALGFEDFGIGGVVGGVGCEMRGDTAAGEIRRGPPACGRRDQDGTSDFGWIRATVRAAGADERGDAGAQTAEGVGGTAPERANVIEG
jgi:hypothetical protein